MNRVIRESMRLSRSKRNEKQTTRIKISFWSSLLQFPCYILQSNRKYTFSVTLPFGLAVLMCIKVGLHMPALPPLGPLPKLLHISG